MKSFSLFAAILALGLTLGVQDADAARRFGSGKSSGMQRESVSSPAQNTAGAPMANKQQMAAPAQQPMAQAPQKRSWMGPLAGLAAGIGLAALASHFGFGEELANFMMMALLAVAVLAVIGFIMRKKAAGAASNNLQYAGAGNSMGGSQAQQYQYMAPASATAPTSTAGNIPADFDVASFTRNAKVNFIRLQAANDTGNLDDIREFTTPEMFAEIKMDLAERGKASQETDVLALEAEVLDVVEEANRYVVSVRFSGSISENKGPAEAVDEIWHLVKPLNGSGGWVVAGIQQVQ